MSSESLAETQGEKFFGEITSFMNGTSIDARKHAAKLMAKDHRTLQQNMMRFFMLFVEEMAQNTSDLRNEDSVALAKAIMNLPDNVQILRHI